MHNTHPHGKKKKKIYIFYYMSKVHTLRTDVATVDDFFSFFFKAKHWESDAPSLCAALGLS